MKVMEFFNDKGSWRYFNVWGNTDRGNTGVIQVFKVSK